MRGCDGGRDVWLKRPAASSVLGTDGRVGRPRPKRPVVVSSGSAGRAGPQVKPKSCSKEQSQ